MKNTALAKASNLIEILKVEVLAIWHRLALGREEFKEGSAKIGRRPTADDVQYGNL